MAEGAPADETDLDAITISQLARLSGVPPRRIRYYVSQRLLAPPSGRGRASHYTGEHLQRLRQIATLREVNLSLDEIRERIGEADSETSEGAHEDASLSGTWHRWEIVPGVELHAREDLDTDTISTLQVLVGAVRHVLTEGNRPSGKGASREE